LKKKISKKDIEDWNNFLNRSEKLENKDNQLSLHSNQPSEKKLDLHGCTLENANKIADEFIRSCFSKNINKIIFITGKGSRSKNRENPYQSETLGILKYSVPEYIKSNPGLLKLIKNINEEDVKNPKKGSFEVYLKKTKV
tara:strand:- start:223 stop:642 length:420 start_codon:yes stop_codon:yes gene_type:complete